MKTSYLIGIIVIVGIVIGGFAMTNNKNTIPENGGIVEKTQKVIDTETIRFSHDGRQLVPSQMSLKSGKDYTIETTPESNGKGCMSTIKREGTTSADAQLVIANESIRFSLPKDTQPGTYKLVCNGMGMQQGEIIIEA